MEKPNIKKLAPEIAGKRGNADSIERHLKRIKRDSRIREYCEDQSFEYLRHSQLDGKRTTPFWNLLSWFPLFPICTETILWRNRDKFFLRLSSGHFPNHLSLPAQCDRA
jgi:hypothetical protein